MTNKKTAKAAGECKSIEKLKQKDISTILQYTGRLSTQGKAANHNASYSDLSNTDTKNLITIIKIEFCQASTITHGIGDNIQWMQYD